MTSFEGNQVIEGSFMSTFKIQEQIYNDIGITVYRYTIYFVTKKTVIISQCTMLILLQVFQIIIRKYLLCNFIVIRFSFVWMEITICIATVYFSIKFYWINMLKLKQNVWYLFKLVKNTPINEKLYCFKVRYTVGLKSTNLR